MSNDWDWTGPRPEDLVGGMEDLLIERGAL